MVSLDDRLIYTYLIKEDNIPAQSEKVACDMIFRGSVVAATFQFPQPLFVGGLIFRGGRCLLLLKILNFFSKIQLKWCIFEPFILYVLTTPSSHLDLLLLSNLAATLWFLQPLLWYFAAILAKWLAILSPYRPTFYRYGYLSNMTIKSIDQNVESLVGWYT